MKYLSIASLVILFLSCSSNLKRLDSKVQTVEFHYIAWACECANWATTQDINRFEGDSLANKSVFIEPADKSLTLPDTLGYNGDIVQFTGQYYIDPGFPKDYIKTEPTVDKAKVFRYTEYKIIRSNYRDVIDDESR